MTQEEVRVEVLRTYLPTETLSTTNVLQGDNLLFTCKGLELRKGPKGKEFGHGYCVSEGTYWAEKEATSPHHTYEHIRVFDVPGRKGILWHVGNYFTDTLGCYLPGESFGDRNKDGILDVLNSKNTLETLLKVLPSRFQITYKEKPKF